MALLQTETESINKFNAINSGFNLLKESDYTIVTNSSSEYIFDVMKRKTKN